MLFGQFVTGRAALEREEAFCGASPEWVAAIAPAWMMSETMRAIVGAYGKPARQAPVERPVEVAA